MQSKNNNFLGQLVVNEDGKAIIKDYTRYNDTPFNDEWKDFYLKMMVEDFKAMTSKYNSMFGNDYVRCIGNEIDDCNMISAVFYKPDTPEKANTVFLIISDKIIPVEKDINKIA